MNKGRVMIAAPKSGSGKTSVTIALLENLKKRNVKVCSFKCGPDYIDPLFHKSVLGIPSFNLDT
ncbi:MAG: cobyrinic acid a,c-diamide synthase, partial [Lachnospiraceae bacterium]|nr:cobyrinic acid a,c-diamide synthase [Lachnospiraceae bacterium]